VTRTVITGELLDELRFEGDPPVDAVIEQHAAERAGAPPATLVADLAAHLELPPNRRSAALGAYLDETPPLPDWADPELMRRGADLFSLRGLEIGSALFLASLPQAYASARGARVLTLTGRLVSDPVRRVYETAQMVFDVLAHDGLSVPDGVGYRDIRRVRLMHAAVRYLILHDPRVSKTPSPEPGSSWDIGDGIPVSQEELVGTLLTFTVVVFETLERQGMPASEADAEAYLHLWCVVGHLLGIRPDVLPIPLAEAREVSAMIREREWGPSTDGELLGGALVGAIQRSLPPPLRGVPPAAIRWYNGPEVARYNGVHGGNLTEATFAPLRVGFGLFGLASSHEWLLHQLTMRCTAFVLGDFVRHGRTGHRPAFTVPEDLQARIRHPMRRWRF